MNQREKLFAIFLCYYYLQLIAQIEYISIKEALFINIMFLLIHYYFNPLSLKILFRDIGWALIVVGLYILITPPPTY